jgi:cytochrome c oxidase cbb3-type subunit 3
LLAGCNSEKRAAQVQPTVAEPPTSTRESDLVPGAYLPQENVRNPFDNNQHAISEGARLFRWYNCNGCHSNGGGGIGPALMDDHWIYGSAPANLYDTIVKGRPNGMPSYSGKIPSYQVWQLVAFVQSLPQPPSPGAQQRKVREAK